MKTRRQVGKGVRALLNLSRSENSKWCYSGHTIDSSLINFIRKLLSNNLTSQFMLEFNALATNKTLNREYFLKYLNALTRQIQNSSYFRSSFNSCFGKKYNVVNSKKMSHKIKQLILTEACKQYNAGHGEKGPIKVEISDNDLITFTNLCSIPYNEKQWYTFKFNNNNTKIRPPNIDDAVKTIIERNNFEDFDNLLNDFLYERLHSTQFQPTDEFNERLNTSLKQLKTELNSLAKCEFEVLEGESLDRQLKNEILLSYCKSYNARMEKHNGVTLYLNIDEEKGYYFAKVF